MKMPPNQSFSLSTVPLEPVSRTYQYRKVMKPLLERKRRARINRCLDELKELMTGTFQNEGENVAKLEKADILELTVRHLHSLRDKNSLFIRQNQDQLNTDRFWDGFRQCAGEVSEFLSKFDTKISIDLLSHINGYRRNLENIQPSIITTTTTNSNSSSSPPPQQSSLPIMKYTNRIPSSTISATTTSIPSSHHQSNLNGGIYPEVFYLNSYHYQNNKMCYSNDDIVVTSEKYQKFPQFSHRKNDMLMENVWRPW